MKISYSTIQSYITEPLPDILTLTEKIIFHAFEVESVEEVQGEQILDIKILPDRAGDCKEERGIAREIAALFGLTLKEPDSYEKGDSIAFTLSKLTELLGRQVSTEEVIAVFDAYHYHYDVQDEKITLFVPPWRKDMATVHDIVDEIGRYGGYESVPALLPKLDQKNILNGELAAIFRKRKELLDAGYNEVITYSLTKKGDFELAHATKGKDHLRTNLLDGLRTAFDANKLNKDILPNSSPRIFEIGRVFPESGEELHVAWINEKEAKEEILSPVSEDGYIFGDQINNPHPFHPWSQFPFITRDIAVWVPENTDPKSLESLYEQEGGDLLARRPILVDMFSKEGRTSYAHRLIFQSYERTLTDEDILPVMDSITSKLKELGYQVR